MSSMSSLAYNVCIIYHLFVDPHNDHDSSVDEIMPMSFGRQHCVTGRAPVAIESVTWVVREAAVSVELSQGR